MADQNDKADATVYRQLSEDMRNGLKEIYQMVSSANDEMSKPPSGTDILFSEASAQLGEIARTIEEAAISIMDIVEKQQERVRERAELISSLSDKLSPEEARKIMELNADLENDLNHVLATLSFQDLAGQRIKKVGEALNAIEKSVVELYLASGLMLDGAKKDPAKDVKTLQTEAKEAIDNFRGQQASQLKGPDKNACSQAAIDDMLAQLGL